MMHKRLRLYSKILTRYVQYKCRSPKPVSAVFRITTRCNLNCPFCLEKHKNSPEMTTEQIKDIISQLEDEIAYLTITGGEPTLRDDFTTIAESIGRSKMYCSLNTNATLLNNLHKVVAMNFDIVRVSLDGPKKMHDQIRGKGSYDRVVHNISELSKIKNRKARIFVHTVIDESNVNGIPELYKNMKDRCDSFSFMPKFENGKYYSNEGFEKLWQELAKTNNVNQMNDFIKNISAGQKFCDAGRLYHLIMPNGDVLACSSRTDLLVGSLQKTGYRQIVNQEMPKDVYRKITNCSGCHSRCSSEISLVFNMNPFQLLCKAPTMLKRYKF